MKYLATATFATAVGFANITATPVQANGGYGTEGKVLCNKKYPNRPTYPENAWCDAKVDIDGLNKFADEDGYDREQDDHGVGGEDDQAVASTEAE